MNKSEINRKIAEEIMGWTLGKDKEWRDSEGKYTRFSVSLLGDKDFFNPSENIADAFEVVEKMLKCGYQN